MESITCAKLHQYMSESKRKSEIERARYKHPDQEAVV